MIYHVEYDGYYTMSSHDQEKNALKRWFDNYKIERYASFACDTEWLVVKELPSSTRRKKRFVCEIGDDGRGTKREVAMDHTAPPAPLITFAAKRRWEPPPPKTTAELRREAEWSRMMAMGYEPIRVPKRRAISARYNPSLTPMSYDEIEYDYEIEWVPSRRRFYDERPRSIMAPQPLEPKHRRNV